MSEVLEGQAVTAGSMLRGARQAAGLHIAALAVSLKVPVSKLEALEADNYDMLPDTVFARALASSVCRTLKIDPGPVLLLLPRNKNPRLENAPGGLNAPVKGRIGTSSGGMSSSSKTVPKKVLAVVLVLLALTAAVVFLPRAADLQTLVQWSESAFSGSAYGVGGPGQTPERSAAAEDVTADNESMRASTVPTAVPLPATVSTTPSSAVPSALPAVDEGAAVFPGHSVPTSSASPLVFRARGESWVQVRDALGAVVLQRNLSLGEVVSVAGSPPFSVVIGRADATEVVVRGVPLDLSAVSRENVARFEVK